MKVNLSLKVENVIKSKTGIMINVGVSIKIQRKQCVCKKDYIWNPVICSCEKVNI